MQSTVPGGSSVKLSKENLDLFKNSLKLAAEREFQHVLAHKKTKVVAAKTANISASFDKSSFGKMYLLIKYTSVSHAVYSHIIYCPF